MMNSVQGNMVPGYYRSICQALWISREGKGRRKVRMNKGGG